MTRESAIALAKTGWWKSLPPEDAALFQLHEDKLCMDFAAFHGGVEKLLGRSVYTHEFGRPGLLRAELKGERAAPTLDEILAMIPAEKRIVLEVADDSPR